MMPFHRQQVPPFWLEKEAQWLALLVAEAAAGSRGDAIDALRWTHQRRPLARWFHDLVRAPHEPRLCAYCDGQLAETSSETIDHFFPKSEPLFVGIALCWQNLFPCCGHCNLTKQAQWSCQLIRPDVDYPADGADDLARFLRLFDFMPETGELRPAPSASAELRSRVELTIRVFKLNDRHRCLARRHRWRDFLNTCKAQDGERSLEMIQHGPYRFVAALCQRARSP